MTPIDHRLALPSSSLPSLSRSPDSIPQLEAQVLSELQGLLHFLQGRLSDSFTSGSPSRPSSGAPTGSTHSPPSRAEGSTPSTPWTPPNSSDVFESRALASQPGDLLPYGNAVDPRNQSHLRKLAHEPGAQRVIAAADKALHQSADPIHGLFSPPPFYKKGQDGIVDTGRDTRQVKQMGKLAEQMNSLSQAYALTGDHRYADKAIEIADAWARTTKPGFGTGQAGISASHPLASVFSSMTALKNYPGWKPEQKARFMDWAHTFAQKAEWKGDRYNNRHDWKMLMQASAAQLTGDKAMFQRKVDEWKDAVRHTIRADGLMPSELGRTRSLHYHLFALKPLMGMAELARGQGIDLYKTPEGQLLRKSLAAVGPALLDRKAWKYKEIHGESPSSGATLYAIAAQRFNDPQLRQLADGMAAAAKQKGDWLRTLVDGQLADGSQNRGGFPIPNELVYRGF